MEINNDYDPEDFHPELFHDYHARAVEQAHGGPVCTGCMDGHVVCEVSGAALKKAAAWRDREGDYYATPELLEEWGAR